MKKYSFALVLTLFILPIFAQNLPSYVPKDGLVGWWPFNGNANDESGNGNHGTVNGATLTTDRDGISSSAYSFDGVSNFIDLNNTENLILNDGLTFSAWFNSKDIRMASIVDKETYPSEGNYGYRLNIRSDESIWAEHGNYGVPKIGAQTAIAKKSYEINNWVHIVGILDNIKGLNTLYLNNVLFDSVSIKLLISNSKKIQVGKATLVQGEYFNGIIDDIAIYNRALSDLEVKQLYIGCSKETATSSSFNSVLLTTGNSVALNAEPQGGVFSGISIENNQFVPSKAKVGLNKVQYAFKNSQGCNDSTFFAMIVADTIGNVCKKYDTITVKNNVFDTVKVNKTIYDTVTVKNNVYDTVLVNKYDTIIVTNKITKYDTITIKNNIYDTITVTNNVTKYDTITVKNILNDTVLVNKYDTITVTNNITKYDTITKTDTVSILKIKFKLTTGINANQLASMSLYPNPTTDLLHVEVGDAKALEGYRYRILDALGKEVYNELVKSAITEIPLKTLGAAGMYQFEVIDAKNVRIQANKIVLY
jgi:hypothetical protein